MNKKLYINPMIKVVSIKTQSHLMEPSVVGANSIDGAAPLEVGGSTDVSDSRGSSFWDDED